MYNILRNMVSKTDSYDVSLYMQQSERDLVNESKKNRTNIENHKEKSERMRKREISHE